MQVAPSKTITKQVIKDIKWFKDERVKFSLKGKIEDERDMYVISAFIDVDGDEEVSVGDYITTGYYEVKASENTTGLNVKVRRVTS